MKEVTQMMKERKEMENKIKTIPLIKAFIIFFVMFSVIVLSAFFKYNFFGSFADASQKIDLYLAVSATAASTLLIMVAFFTYLLYSRQTLVENTRKLGAICAAITLTCVVCIYV